jgi:hypothetical protein
MERHGFMKAAPIELFLWGRHEDHELVFMGKAQQATRFLVHKIAIYGLAPHQVDLMLPLDPFGMQKPQILLQNLDLMLVFVLGLEAALAVQGMPYEIAPHGAGDAVQQQREEDCAGAPADDHSPTLANHG